MECIPPAVLAELRREFLEETRETLEAAEAELANLAGLDASRRGEALHRVYRRVHGLKGAAGMFGFPRVTEFCHRVEDLLESFDPAAAAAPQELAHLARAFLLLHETFAGGDASGDLPEAAMEEWSARLAASTPAPGTPAPSAPRADGASPGQEASPEWDGRRGSVRVAGPELDGLGELAGEIQLAARRLLLRLETRTVHGDDRGELVRDGVLLARRAGLLRRRVRALRLVPLRPLFAPLGPLVRVLAEDAGKQVELVVEGDETRVDRSMLDAMTEPVVHLVRNAIDHGIERADLRVLEGKPPAGRLHITASSDGTHVRLEIADDGRGVDRAAVRRAAAALGNPLPEDADDAEVLRRLFEEGFSTRDHADSISGRGMGLHAVRRAVGELRGMLDIRSEPGRGTRISLRVPESITLTQGLQVQLGPHRVVIPAPTVVGVRRPDDAVPGLRRIAPFGGTPAGSLVIAGAAERRIGILVDHVAGRQELLVRPLGPLLQGHPLLSGVAELADGGLAWVLDPARLLLDTPPAPFATMHPSFGAAETLDDPPEGAEEFRRGSWLVVAVRRELFAVRARHVLAVLSPREPTPVPLAPPPFLGVLLHRGRILPVFDVSLLRDERSEPLGTGMMVALRAREEFALRVSGVPGMIRPQEGDAPPRWNGRALPVLDVTSLPLKTFAAAADGKRTVASREGTGA